MPPAGKCLARGGDSSVRPIEGTICLPALNEESGGLSVRHLCAQADWRIVERGWHAHVLGEAEHKFNSALEAVKKLRVCHYKPHAGIDRFFLGQQSPGCCE